MAPPITEATQNARSNPDAVETAAAIGVRRVMVPTEVPIATDTKQATINSTKIKKKDGEFSPVHHLFVTVVEIPVKGRRQPNGGVLICTDMKYRQRNQESVLYIRHCKGQRLSL